MKEKRLLRRLQRHDTAALEELMVQYTPYVSAVVWNLLGAAASREDMEEVAGDVFLAAWEQACDIQPGKLKAWLGAVARNKARQRLRGLGMELPLEEDILELPGPDGPQTELEREENARLVREAVDSLSPSDREIFLRHYYYGQTVERVSGEMDMNPSTVKTRLRRGREKLKAILIEGGIFDEG